MDSDDGFEIISNKFDTPVTQAQIESSIEIFKEVNNARVQNDGNKLEGIQNFVHNLNIFYEKIYKIEENLKDDEEIKWSIRNYFTLPLRLYYSVMILITLLKVRETNDLLTREEKEWLNKFNRSYPSKELSIAGPLAPVLHSFKSYKTTTSPKEPVRTEIKQQNLNNLFKVGIDEIELVFKNHLKLVLEPIIIFGAQLRNLSNQRYYSTGESKADRVNQKTDETKIREKTQQPHMDEANFTTKEDSLIEQRTLKPFPESGSRFKDATYYWRIIPHGTFPSITLDTTQIDTFLQKSEIIETHNHWFYQCYELAKGQAKHIPESTTLDQIN
jgi:hypothetical protein